jgi:hypothetical protein
MISNLNFFKFIQKFLMKILQMFRIIIGIYDTMCSICQPFSSWTLLVNYNLNFDFVKWNVILYKAKDLLCHICVLTYIGIFYFRD